MTVYGDKLQELEVDVGYVSLYDVSGIGLDLTLVGATWSGTGGPGPSLPGYINLDGVDDYATADDDDSITYVEFDSGSHGVWIWVPDTENNSDDWAVVFGKGAGGGYEFRHTASIPDLRWSPRASLGVEDIDTPTGEWVFYAATIEYEGNLSSRLRLLRRQGTDESMVEVFNEALTNEGYRYPATHSGDLFLGTRGGTQRYFHGRITGYFSVRRLLTVAEFDDLYDAAMEESAPANSRLWSVATRETNTDLVSSYSAPFTFLLEEADPGHVNLGAPDSLVVVSEVTSPTLTQASQVAPDGLTVEGVVSSPTVTQAHSAAPGAASVDAVVSEPTVAQAHDLAPDGLVSVSDVNEPGLQQEGALNPDNQAVHSFVSEPTLSQGHELTASGIDCSTAVSSPQTVQDYKLVANAIVSDTVVSSPTLIQAHSVVPDGLVSITTSVGGTLSQVGEANPDDIASNNTVSSPNLTQSHSIQAESLTSTTTVSDSSLTQAHSVAPDGLVSTTFAGSPTISQEGELGVDDVAVVNTVSSPNLTQNYALTAEGVSVSSEVSTAIIPTMAASEWTSYIEATTSIGAINLGTPDSLTVTNVTESPGISTAGDIVVDGDVVNTFISEPALVQASEINVFNIDIVTTVSTTTVFDPTLVTYGIGSLVVGVTVYQVTPELEPEFFNEVHSTITSPTLLQNHVDLGTPHTLIIENFTSSPTAGIPPIVEIGVAPGYPKIDDEPATVALDAEFDVLPVFDPVAASTSRLDAQQDTDAGIQMVFINTVKIDDQPNEVRIG